MTTEGSANLESVTNLIYAALRRLINEPGEETTGDYRFHSVESAGAGVEPPQLIVTLHNPNGEPQRFAIGIQPVRE